MSTAPTRPLGAAFSAPRRKGIGLIRVSRERDGTTSPEVQRHAIETYAAGQHIDIVEWVQGVDEAKFSGSRRNSKWWAKLDYAIEQVEKKRVDVVVGWKFSRAARNRLRWAVALDRVETAGGTLESATEPTDASPSGRFARGMLGEMNAYQAELIGETWRETHDRRRRAGLPHDGLPRYGYDVVDGQYVPSPGEGPVVAEMYRRVVDGHGFTSVARWANQRAHHTKAGRQWSRSSLTTMLDSGFAAGLIIQRAPKTTAYRDRNPLTASFHPGAHTALIDEATWDAYLARRAATERGKPVHAPRYMLSGLVRCGDCGATMHVSANARGGSYSCSRATVAGTLKVSIQQAALERIVTDWLRQIPADLDASARRSAEAQARQRVTRIENREALERLITRNQDRTVALTIRHLDGTIPEDAYRITLAKLEAEHATLQERLAQTARPAPTLDVRATVPRFVDGWATTPPEAQNRLLQALVARITVNPAPRPGTGTADKRVQITPKWDS